MYLDKLKALVTESIILRNEQFVGCSVIEIKSIEQQLHLSLPEAYKEFLQWMGKDAGPVLKGSNCFYKDLLFLHQGALNLLKENGLSASLPKDAFVFFMHQGYQFAFMRTLESPDPKIYYYNEVEQSDTNFVVSYNKFSDFLEDEIKRTIDYLRRYL